MPNFLRSGNSIRVVDDKSQIVTKRLEGGFYTIKYNDVGAFYYLEDIDAFELPNKFYGDVQSKADRIYTTFLQRDNSTGVLLTGEKGSGKTLLAKILANRACSEDYPVIVVNEPFCGDLFNRFIQGLSQPAVIVFDEFEKTYNMELQSKLLTLLDGTASTKCLFIMTCNNKYRVDGHMINRPGRLYYALEFNGLDMASITEFCNEKLENKEHVDNVVRLTSAFEIFNFDMLKALVEEMNRFDESPYEAIQILNVKIVRDTEEFNVYDVKITDAKGVLREEVYPDTFHGNPVATRSLSFTQYAEEDDDEPDNVIVFTLEDLVMLDHVKGEISYRNSDGEVLVLTLREAPNDILGSLRHKHLI